MDSNTGGEKWRWKNSQSDDRSRRDEFRHQRDVAATNPDSSSSVVLRQKKPDHDRRRRQKMKKRWSVRPDVSLVGVPPEKQCRMIGAIVLIFFGLFLAVAGLVVLFILKGITATVQGIGIGMVVVAVIVLLAGLIYMCCMCCFKTSTRYKEYKQYVAKYKDGGKCEIEVDTSEKSPMTESTSITSKTTLQTQVGSNSSTVESGGGIHLQSNMEPSEAMSSQTYVTANEQTPSRSMTTTSASTMMQSPLSAQWTTPRGYRPLRRNDVGGEHSMYMQTADGVGVDVDYPVNGRHGIEFPAQGRSDVDYPVNGRGGVDYQVNGHSDVDYQLHGRGDVDPVHGRGNIEYPVHGYGHGDVDYHLHRQGDVNYPVQGRGDVDYQLHRQGDVDYPAQGRGDVDYQLHRQGDVDYPAQGRGDVDYQLHRQGDVDYPAQGRGDVNYPVQGRSDVDYQLHGRGDVEYPVHGRGDLDLQLHGHGGVGDLMHRQGDVQYEHGSMMPERGNQDVHNSLRDDFDKLEEALREMVKNKSDDRETEHLMAEHGLGPMHTSTPVANSQRTMTVPIVILQGGGDNQQAPPTPIPPTYDQVIKNYRTYSRSASPTRFLESDI